MGPRRGGGCKLRREFESSILAATARDRITNLFGQHVSPRVVERLDGAFAALIDILDCHGGIVNKFLGDGFLALFGAPRDAPHPARNAVAAAREMLEANERVNSTSSWPLRIGIGIHVGEVVAGNIGSPRRKEYPVMGDTVNSPRGWERSTRSSIRSS